jgi:hypothetical protein
MILRILVKFKISNWFLNKGMTPQRNEFWLF